MDNDLVLVVGIVIALLTVPSMMSAWMDGRPPRVAAILLMLGCVMVIYALSHAVPAYRIENLPHVFVEVIGRYLR